MARTSFAVVCILLAASTIQAADSGRGQWSIGVEGSWVNPANDDLVLGTPVNATTGGPDGNLVTIDYGTAAAYAINVGFAARDWGYALHYWSFDQDASRTVQSETGYLPAFENPLFGDTFANRLDGSAKLESTVTDLEWTRVLSGTGKSRWDWIVGLRSSSVEQSSTMTDDADGEGGFDDQVVAHSKATGIGIVTGIVGRHDFSSRVWGSVSFRMAFLSGSLDVSRSENAFDVPLFSQLSGADRTFRQEEIDARLNVRVFADFGLYLGYGFKKFDGSVAQLVVPDDVADGTVIVNASDVAFSGFSIGATFSF